MVAEGEMSGSKLKIPTFNPDEDAYESFRKDLQIWDTFSDLGKEKKGPAVYLSLPKNVREGVRDLTIDTLSSDNGLSKIIEKLDDIYLADANTRAYLAFQKFYVCKRECGETYEAFIVRFEQLYNDLSGHDMTLPDGIRAFFLLNASNLPDDLEKLARATTENLTYTNMRTQIKKICTNTLGSSDDVAPPLKARGV